MQQVITLDRSEPMASERRPFVLDTTFVLFFLAIDLGASVSGFGIDALLSSMTLILFIFVPYFLPFEGDRPEFGKWVAGRSAIALIAVMIGLMFRQTIGVAVPEHFRHLPMTLLIGSAILSGAVQFYAIMRTRLAR